MQAKEALSFQVIMAIADIIAGILVIFLIGIPLLIIFGIVTVVLPIIAFIKVIDGVDYSYPITSSIARKL